MFPMFSRNYFSDKEFAIFCRATEEFSGELSVEKIECHNPVRFSNVCSLHLSTDYDMPCPRIDFSNHSKHFIIYDSCGAILSYSWNVSENRDEDASVYKPCLIEHRFIDDNITSDCLSLEQQKQFEEELRRKAQVRERKTEMLEKIAKLKNEFIAIKEKNNELPEKYRLPAAAFDIDKRIIDDLKWRTAQKFKAIQGEMQRKIDRIRTQAERMEHIYLDNLEHWPIIITGFRYVTCSLSSEACE